MTRPITRQKPIRRPKKRLEQRLAFVTSNPGKVDEVRELMAPFAIDIVRLILPELQGDGEAIAAEKASYACSELQRPVLVDDTGLGFSAWQGLPGPYIGQFHKRLGTLGLYHLVEPFDDRKAAAQCFLGYCEPGKKPIVFVGTVDGTLVAPRRSTDRSDTASFGWDPIFQPDGYSKTFGEMTMDEKNVISHRRRAIDKLKKYLSRG